MQKPFDIPDAADVEYVYDGLMHLGAIIAIDTIHLIASKLPEDNLDVDFSHVLDEISVPQEQENIELKSAPKIFKETCEINWSQPAKTVYDFIRGLSPYPGAWSSLVLNDDSESKPLVMKV